MIDRVLVDTGPIVAILSHDDADHEKCVNQSKLIRPPLLTCWPVLTEAAWLLRHRPPDIQRMFHMIDAGMLELLPLDRQVIPWIADFMSRYRDLGRNSRIRH